MHKLLLVIIVGLLIMAMIILLLGINRYILGENETPEETDALRREGHEDPQPVSRHSLFNKFLTSRRSSR